MASGSERPRRLRILSVATLVALLAITVTSSWFTRRLVRDQESRLLRERASEVSLILSTAIGTFQGSLSSLASAPVASPTPGTSFSEIAARQLQQDKSARALAVVRPTPNGFVVDRAAGSALAAGEI